MGFNKEKMMSLEVIKLTEDDLRYLFKSSGLTGNQLTLHRDWQNSKGALNPSVQIQNLINKQVDEKVALLLLEPDIKIFFHSGGSFAQEIQYYALASCKINEIIIESSDMDGNIEIAIFSDWSQFIDWWIDRYVKKSNETSTPLFSEREELEILVCVFHCIDVYRRAFMESMLNCEFLINTEFRKKEFIDFLKESTAKADNRWLLPNLFNLTPGLKNAKIALTPEHLKRIAKLSFIRGTETATINLDEMTKLSGIEFLSGWQESVGMLATVAKNNELINLDQKYLALTELTNHQFTFETNRVENKKQFSYQALSSDHLKKIMKEWIIDLKKIAFPEGIAQPERPKSNRYCKKCGNQLKSEQKFCTKCGTSVG